MGYCYHCHGLTDNEVLRLQERVRQEHRAHRVLGLRMLFLVGIGVALLATVVVLAILGW